MGSGNAFNSVRGLIVAVPLRQPELDTYFGKQTFKGGRYLGGIAIQTREIFIQLVYLVLDLGIGNQVRVGQHNMENNRYISGGSFNPKLLRKCFPLQGRSANALDLLVILQLQGRISFKGMLHHRHRSAPVLRPGGKCTTQQNHKTGYQAL
jgi:hypothetical protein